MRTASVPREGRPPRHRLVVFASVAALCFMLLGGLWLLSDGPTYWRCVARHALRRVTLRDTRFAWQQRVEQSVARWEQEVFPKLYETERRVAALQAAAYAVSKPDLAAHGADPVFTLLGNGWQQGESRSRVAGRRRQWLAWLDEARRWAPDDAVVIWQQATARSRRGARLYAQAVDRPLIEQGARADAENAFWHYLLATMPGDGELFQRAALGGRGAFNDQSASADPFEVRQGELQSIFKAVGLDWTLAASPLVPLVLRDPAQFATAAERAMRSAEYRHPQADANRRIERAAPRLGLPAWSRAKLRAWLSKEFAGGREFSRLYSHRSYQPTSLYAYAEVSLLRDALAAQDRDAAQASYRRLLGLFRHLWEAYPSDEQREATRFELLQPCLTLLGDPLVQQTGCFPAEFAEQIRREHAAFVAWRGEKGAGTMGGSLFATGASGQGAFGPSPAARAWLILCDCLARAGLALGMVAGLLWMVARGMGRRGRRQDGEGVVAQTRAPTAAWLAPCILFFSLAGLEAVLSVLDEYAATLTPSQGTGQFLFIAWALAWSTAAAVLATFRRHRDVAMPRNLGVLAFVAVLLGCYYAMRLFGVHLPNGIVMIPWSNVAHVMLDPTRGRSYYEILEGREIALVLAPPALATTVVAVNGLLQARRTHRKRGAEAAAEPVGVGEIATRSAAGRAAPHWGRRALVAGGASLVLWSSLGLVMGLRVWVELPAAVTEEETLRGLRDDRRIPPQRAVDAAALVVRSPVDLGLRLRSARGFWQYLAGSLLLAIVLFAVTTPADPSGPRHAWTARLSLWPPERCAALRRCLTATLGWLAVFGVTVHLLGFVAAGYWIHRLL